MTPAAYTPQKSLPAHSNVTSPLKSSRSQTSHHARTSSSGPSVTEVLKLTTSPANSQHSATRLPRSNQNPKTGHGSLPLQSSKPNMNAPPHSWAKTSSSKVASLNCSETPAWASPTSCSASLSLSL